MDLREIFFRVEKTLAHYNLHWKTLHLAFKAPFLRRPCNYDRVIWFQLLLWWWCYPTPCEGWGHGDPTFGACPKVWTKTSK